MESYTELVCCVAQEQFGDIVEVRLMLFAVRCACVS